MRLLDGHAVIGFDVYPELLRRQRRRQTPESLLMSMLGGGLAAAFVCVMGLFVLMVGA